MHNTYSVYLLGAAFCLAGCAEPTTVTQSQSQVENPQSVTTSPDPRTGTTDQSAGDIPAEFTAKVIAVIDGDTIDVLTDSKETIRIRFNGIDAPERGQPFGNNARETVSESIGGQMVRIVTHGEDRYGRIIGDIYHSGTMINLALVKAGMAWHYVRR